MNSARCAECGRGVYESGGLFRTSRVGEAGVFKCRPCLQPTDPQPDEEVEELVKAGLWEQVEGGYRVRNYHPGPEARS